MTFTDFYLQSLKTEKRLEDIMEGDGFGVRVYATGAKVFFYRYRFDGKRRFLNLGYYDEKARYRVGKKEHGSLAFHRMKYMEAKMKVAMGEDPLFEQQSEAAERKRTPFVADFVDEYVTRYSKEHNRGWREIERALKSEIVPRWGRRKLTDIRRRDLVLILDEIKDRGAPIMANRVLAYVRKMFSYAVTRDVIESNPFLGMQRPAKEVARERNLSADEIRILWNNLDRARMSESVRRALKLILVTGQRPGEVIGLHSREIDGQWWTIPPERSKNRQAHRVFLAPLALELIGSNDGYIFESPAASAKGDSPSVGHYQVQTMTHDIKANLPHTPKSKVEDRLKIPYFTPHDLRRTASSRMAEMGIAGDIIDRVQNHVTKQKQGVGHVYNRYSYDREKQVALEAWERYLRSVVSDETRDNVLPLLRKSQEA